MALTRIFADEFCAEWDKAFDNWHGKFHLRAKKTMTACNGGYGTSVFDPKESFWCHIWHGPHCIFGATELIPDVTIVTGVKCSPMFFSPKEVVEKFVFEDKNPFTSRYVPAHTPYWDALQKIKQQIRENAAKSV